MDRTHAEIFAPHKDSNGLRPDLQPLSDQLKNRPVTVKEIRDAFSVSQTPPTTGRLICPQCGGDWEKKLPRPEWELSEIRGFLEELLEFIKREEAQWETK